MTRRGLYKAHGQPDVLVLDNGERTQIVHGGAELTTIGPWIRWQLMLNDLAPTYTLAWEFKAMIDAGHYRHDASSEKDYPKETT